ncbi:MAG: Clp protease N-terminal domain-containing protein [Acidimicrobiales bacterium]
MNTLFTAAEKEAALVGEAEYGTEHLVLAAFDLPDGSAARAFKRVGVDPHAFRKAINDQHAEALRAIGIAPEDGRIDSQLPEPPDPKGPMKSKGSSQNVFKKVVKLVKKEKSQLYGAYIILVAAEAEAGSTARALETLGVHRKDLAAAARIELDALNA